MHTYVRTYLHTFTYACILTYKRIQIDIYMHTYINACSLVHLPTYLSACLHSNLPFFLSFFLSFFPSFLFSFLPFFPSFLPPSLPSFLPSFLAFFLPFFPSSSSLTFLTTLLPRCQLNSRDYQSPTYLFTSISQQLLSYPCTCTHRSRPTT